MIITPKVDSALHILKGAVQKVLGATITTNVYGEENKGRLSVEFNRKIDEKEIKEIEEQANNKVKENVPIEILKMDRKDAEEKFGYAIYDKFSVPSHITDLTIVRIKDWNVNCCIGKHIKSTGDLKEIKILKYRFRKSKKQLEISFVVD